MPVPLRVLLVEDSEDDAELIARELRKGDYAPVIRRVETETAMRGALAEPWDVVISDYSLPQFSGSAALALVRTSGLDVPFIVVSGAIGEEVAVAAMRAGAHDYLMKGNLRRLVPAIQRELREADERHRRRRAEEERAAIEQAARHAEKLAALGTLAAGLAHELNNPIGIMCSRIEVMLLEAEATGLPEAIRGDLQVLHRNAQRVARIAQGLLSFSRRSSSARDVVQLNDVVRETLLLTERQVTRAGVRLVVETAEALPPVRGDGSALEQVLLNLVTNAAAAVGTSGEIRITTRRHPERSGCIQLLVADTGCGIPPDVMPRVFDPFFSTKPSGTGLGLSVSDGIVREHGGTIDVESTPDQGTRFTITLPALPPESPPEPPPPRT
jgi:signal transduction histidine kinase